MKTIGVLLQSLTVEYTLKVLSGITSYFKDKPVRILIAQTKDPHCAVGVYEYQCWASAEYLFSQETDAFIIITGSYSSDITNRNLSKLLEKIGERPVVSIGIELNLPNSYTIKANCKEAYNSIVQHLVHKHHCNKIGFLSANTTLSTEALDRFEAYKAALKKNGLKYDENLVLNGNFTISSARTAIEGAYKTKEDVPFAAILCANDLMAVGAEQALQKLGFVIPDEIKIFGFDESSLAVTVKPKLSTIDQNIFEQGHQAAILMEKILKGRECRRTKYIPVKILYRQSCGCVSMNNPDNVYRDENYTLHFTRENQNGEINEVSSYYDFLNGIGSIYTLSDLAKAAATMSKLRYTLSYMMQTARMDSMIVCLFDKPENLQREDDIVIPKRMRLSMVIHGSQNHDEIEEKSIFEPGIYFNPKKILFPGDKYKNVSGNYMLQPIFSGEVTYGYIICKLNASEFAIYSMFTKILINAISQAYEYTDTVTSNEKLLKKNTQLMEDNTTLDKKAKTDELTKILNRRGFINQAQKTIKLNLENECNGLVFFADMDGLKKINDTYGHKTGDRAIQGMANALKNTFRASDVVGRLSGDEFGVVAPGLNPEQADDIRQKIQENCIQESIEADFKFTLSCSFGCVEFSEDCKDLKTLLAKADELLYIEKKQKKALNR